MIPSCVRLRLLALIALAAGTPPAHALSYVMIRDDALADRATVVVAGEAVAELPGASDANGYLTDTRYQIDVERQIKGRGTLETLVLRLPGADTGEGPTVFVPGTARLQPGSRVLLFLQPRGDGTFEPADLALGVFHEVESAGARLYVRDLDGAHEAGKRINQQYHQPRDAARFEQWLLHRARGWQRGADYFAAVDGAVLQSKFNQTRTPTGPVRWFKFDTGVFEPWFAIQGGQTGMVNDEFALFQNAIAAWVAHSTSIVRYNYAGTTATDSGRPILDGKSAIIWNDPKGDITGSYNCTAGGTLATGGAYIDGTQMQMGDLLYKRIIEGFIILQDGAACALDGHNGEDGEEVMGHELGHTLGLQHSCGDAATGSCSTPVLDDSLMRATLHADGRGARLGADEMAAMSFIYPGNDPPPPPPADLGITKTHSGNFTQGQVGASYAITVGNTGANASSGAVTVVDTLPAGLTATAMAGSGWTCTLASLSCTRTTALAAATSYPPIILTVNVAGNAPAQVVNTATVSGGGDTTPGNNTATDPTNVLPPPSPPDLSISKTHVGNFVQGQAGATYTITVSNSPAGATSGTVTVVDTLPAGLTATALVGSGWTCVLSSLTCTRSSVLAAGASYPPITLMVNVAGNAPQQVVNTATVSGGGDATPGNNTATDPTTVVPPPPPANLSISKTHPGNFTQGQAGAFYTITVSNIGGGSSAGTVTVVDNLPAGLTATAMSGTGWTCVLATLTCTRSGALGAGASYQPIILSVNVANNAPSEVVNTATVSGGGDATPGNNTATDPTSVLPQRTVAPDLAIMKSHAGSFTQGQVGATYTITVSNGTATSTSGTVTVIDSLPAGLTATAISGSGWNCVLASLSCSRDNALAVGTSYPAITVTVNVAANAPSQVTNTATVSGGGDASSGNNTATDPTTVVPTQSQGGDTVFSNSFE